MKATKPGELSIQDVQIYNVARTSFTYDSEAGATAVMAHTPVAPSRHALGPEDLVECIRVLRKMQLLDAEGRQVDWDEKRVSFTCVSRELDRESGDTVDVTYELHLCYSPQRF